MVASTISPACTFFSLVTSIHSSSECDRPPAPRPIVIAGMPMLIGTFASVLPISNVGEKPYARLTAAALECFVDSAQFIRRFGAHVDQHEHLGRNRVDRRAAADDTDVESGPRS